MDITAPAKICASLLPLIYLQKISIGNFDEQVGLVALVAKWFRFEGFLKKGRLRREVVMMMMRYFIIIIIIILVFFFVIVVLCCYSSFSSCCSLFYYYRL